LYYSIKMTGLASENGYDKQTERINQGFERRSISRLANKKAANPFKSFTSTD